MFYDIDWNVNYNSNSNKTFTTLTNRLTALVYYNDNNIMLLYAYIMHQKKDKSNHREVSLKSITKFHPDRHTRKWVNKNMVKSWKTVAHVIKVYIHSTNRKKESTRMSDEY